MSVFRNSHSGILCVSDYLGTIHAQLNSRRLADRGVIVYLPTKGAKTFYALAGNWFVACGGIGIKEHPFLSIVVRAGLTDRHFSHGW